MKTKSAEGRNKITTARRGGSEAEVRPLSKQQMKEIRQLAELQSGLNDTLAKLLASKDTKLSEAANRLLAQVAPKRSQGTGLEPATASAQPPVSTLAEQLHKDPALQSVVVLVGHQLTPAETGALLLIRPAGSDS